MRKEIIECLQTISHIKILFDESKQLEILNIMFGYDSYYLSLNLEGYYNLYTENSVFNNLNKPIVHTSSWQKALTYTIYEITKRACGFK